MRDAAHGEQTRAGDRTRERATTPEDLTRLFVERANARDAAGLAELYTTDAVLAYPPESPSVGREAIRAACEQMLRHVPLPFLREAPLPTVRCGDLALTSTRSGDGSGVRVQVVRREPDGSWLRVIDRPEVPESS
ncbi:SnoaL-like domain-containing protein [Streptomyces sp. PLAI1-29]|uniref:SnoaL-like domain-containing protein n=2 Tax=Streptomyces zingiberis TaxID=2053010 RepID=A0ABX1BVJ7_9ACTN|nr:SnoaL-like domain-containing protein [Streptomyces zingiberis]